MTAALRLALPHNRTDKKNLTRRTRCTSEAHCSSSAWSHLPSVLAGQATITWYDPTCRYFVAQLPEGSEGFDRLSEGRTELKVGTVLEGDAGWPGPGVGRHGRWAETQGVALGRCQSQDVLVRHSPGWCKSKRKKPN
jgi:hypothetical protein